MRIHHGKHVASRRAPSWVGAGVAFFLWWLASLIAIANVWIVLNFGPLELSQFVYHLVNIAEVIRPMGAGFIVISVMAIIVLPITVGIMGPLVTRRLVAGAKQAYVAHVDTPHSHWYSRLGHRVLSPGLAVTLLVPGLVLGASTPAFAHNIGAVSFVQNAKPSSFIEAFYEFPKDISTPAKPLNLVMIYVESLENTYRNPDLWGENLLDSLDYETRD